MSINHFTINSQKYTKIEIDGPEMTRLHTLQQVRKEEPPLYIEGYISKIKRNF